VFKDNKTIVKIKFYRVPSLEGTYIKRILKVKSNNAILKRIFYWVPSLALIYILKSRAKTHLYNFIYK
jgi:hypothetical protein